MSKHKSERIVVKIGSNVLARKDGFLNKERISHLAEQLTILKEKGTDVIVVSSGAVATGREMMQLSQKLDTVGSRQLFAAIGQVKLMNTWSTYCEAKGKLTAQILLTKEDFKDRIHYLNIKNCLDNLLRNNVIPVINENDVVSVTELMFTDNDELAGLISAMIDADKLIILSNVDGIYNGNPENASSQIIETVQPNAKLASFIRSNRSEFGRGGMLTKSQTAQKIAAMGIAVHIANGYRDNVLLDTLTGKVVHTRFVPSRRRSAKKKWIAHSEGLIRGTVIVNKGAIDAITSSKAISVLPVGMICFSGEFKKGELVAIANEHGDQIGVGIAGYSADKLKERIGLQRQQAFIHYDHLYLNQ